MKLHCEVESDEAAIAARVIDEVATWERERLDWKVILVGSLRGGQMLCDRLEQDARKLVALRREASLRLRGQYGALFCKSSQPLAFIEGVCADRILWVVDARELSIDLLTLLADGGSFPVVSLVVWMPQRRPGQ